jgi:L-threonylcarbamoyladenylate synthase
MRITVEDASRHLLAGDVVALPTETVYGLAASLSNPLAIEKIFSLKNRPSSNPLIVHIASKEQLLPLVPQLPAGAEQLMEHFWPGALSLILQAVPGQISAVATANLATVAVRMVDHPLTHQVIQNVGPIVMPSANLSGKPSATQACHVEDDFGINFPVVDGGSCVKGIESTIVAFDCSRNRWQIARLGAIGIEELEELLGYSMKFLGGDLDKPICPGQMFRHYAPQAALKLCETFSGEEKGILLGYSDRSYPKQCNLWSLGKSTQPEAVAASLYSLLRRLDMEAVAEAYVDINVPKEGLWLAIYERLKKAAAK